MQDITRSYNFDPGVYIRQYSRNIKACEINMHTKFETKKCHRVYYIAPSTRAFFKDFPVGGIFWKGTFLWDNILEGDSNGWRPRVLSIYTHEWGVWGSTPQEKFWNLNPGNVISCILSIQICSKIYANYTCIWNKRWKNAQKVKKNINCNLSLLIRARGIIQENFWNLKPWNAISCILSIQKIKKLLTIIYHYLVVKKSNNLNRFC
jgi:hypothetical protein